MRKADRIKNYDGQNPFFDNQARNFSDEKVLNEFYPISSFWDLFNDQHEIILGTRGSGKTFLLKMMRYSMLKRLNFPEAKKMVHNKNFIAFYVPMHLEFVANIAPHDISREIRITAFQIAFNFLLSQSILHEIKSFLEDFTNPIEQATIRVQLAHEIGKMWLIEGAEPITDIVELERRINEIFYGFDPSNPNNESIPIVFRKQICTPLVSIKDILLKRLNLKANPTWLVCIDEAEFLDNALQECINNVFRSDSNRIALKVATLPFSHTTLNTFSKDVTVAAGNDFLYHVIDMDYDSADFINLTNRLCAHRIASRVDPAIKINTLEDFLGKIGNDDLIDYYRNEIGEKTTDRDTIEERIVSSFSEKRKVGASGYKNRRKTIYDKYATIFFTREMYKLSKQGNRKPGWYAGAKTVRKIAQGNPRAFLQIMSLLFEEAKQHSLQPKTQHQVLRSYARNFCLSTKGLNEIGPIIYKQLDEISCFLQSRVHEGYLVSAGASFILSFKSESDFRENIEWIQAAIANSRLIVSNEIKTNGITINTKYLLSYAYAAEYWIPMRSDIPTHYMINKESNNASYQVQTKKSLGTRYDRYTNGQLSLFGED